MSIRTAETPRTAALLSPQIRLRPGDYEQLHRDSVEVRERLAEASDVVGRDLAGLLRAGTEDELNRGAVARPAVVALSVACYRQAMRGLPDSHGLDSGGLPDYLAGLSLGQITAAHLAGCLSFADAVRMAVTMATIEAEEFDGRGYGVFFYTQVAPDRLLAAAAELDAAGQYLRPCALLADDQVIMSGTLRGLARLAQVAFDLGGAGVVIPFGPPAHCALMAGVQRRFAAEWAPTDPGHDPRVPLICNITTRPLRTRKAVLHALVTQYTATVRWSDSLRRMAGLGVRRVVTPGPGGFLARSLQSTAVPFEVVTGAAATTPGAAPAAAGGRR